ncbi:type II/IV secretion system ATPase subunit [Candidatus Micrarchaeota archaeon]|nr:type II/IV secretion system ATPase subunit [Candidatus Micrarchaeota archaeon]
MKMLATYKVVSENVPAEIIVAQKDDEYINTYELKHAKIREATKAVLDFLKEKIIDAVDIKISEILDPREAEFARKRLIVKAHELVKDEFAGLNKEDENIIVGRLVQEMVGLGELELLLADDRLEEVVVNSSHEPVYVYHKEFGWLKTNIFIANEEQIHNYASIIGRKIGKQITNLSPLMDAHLLTGSRVNATLFPISSKGNGITIRKFSKEPWTVINFIDPVSNTLSPETAALLWLCMQYELNVLIGGGTASGKTSFLNSILVFTPPNQRVITIEDTRELILPEFLNWTPLVTREPNPEGKGGIAMLDLLVNSLRMRPDRIVLGEMRRQREAEVLFEAMHTGHAVYATVHADDAEHVKSRLISPPIALPEQMLNALHLTIVQYRQRRTGIRRTFEIAEFIPQEKGVGINTIYRWSPKEDKLKSVGKQKRLFNELGMHTGMSEKELEKDLAEKEKVLKYMVAQKVNTVNEVGKVVAWYYRDKEKVLKTVEKNLGPKELLGGK